MVRQPGQQTRPLSCSSRTTRGSALEQLANNAIRARRSVAPPPVPYLRGGHQGCRARPLRLRYTAIRVFPDSLVVAARSSRVGQGRAILGWPVWEAGPRSYAGLENGLRVASHEGVP